MKHPLPPNCSDSYNNTAALCRKIAIFAATDPLPHSCQQSYGRYRTHPREYFRCRPPRSDIGAHRHPCPPRSLHSGYRPGRHPPLAVAGHPFQNLLGPLWRHNERPALQVLRAKCGNPLHSREPRGIRRVGGPAGQEPLDYHHSRTQAHGTPHRRRYRRNRPPAAQHRRHPAPHRPPAPWRGRGTEEQELCGIQRPRQPAGHNRNARPLPGAQPERGVRHLITGGQCVPPLPPSDMLRHGFHSDRDRSYRRTRRPRGSRSTGAGNNGKRHARRNRLLRKLHPPCATSPSICP